MNKKLIIAGLVILIIVGYLFYSGMKESAAYFLEIDEFMAQKENLNGKGSRVNGELVPESVQWDAENIILNFKLTSGTDTLAVRYEGVPPDTFNEAVSVVVEGKYENEIFHATQLMTKCPSKYEAKNE